MTILCCRNRNYFLSSSAFSVFVRLSFSFPRGIPQPEQMFWVPASYIASTIKFSALFAFLLWCLLQVFHVTLVYWTEQTPSSCCKFIAHLCSGSSPTDSDTWHPAAVLKSQIPSFFSSHSVCNCKCPRGGISYFSLTQCHRHWITFLPAVARHHCHTPLRTILFSGCIPQFSWLDQCLWLTGCYS